ncbi:MAG: transposase [Oscillospiraceae bacterium]|nr:transposase [Oscillospiraceae bacterium]
MSELPKRKPTRLRKYDYSSSGAYFVTFNVTGMHRMLGTIVGAGSTRPPTKQTPYVELSVHGQVVDNAIQTLPEKYDCVIIDNYVIMPNHAHMIIIIDNHGRVDPAPTLSSVVGYLKYQTMKEIKIRGIWQRGFHDHIIRNAKSHNLINRYIRDNPKLWKFDCHYTEQRNLAWITHNPPSA